MIEELLNETKFKKFYLFRIFTAMKRDENLKNKFYKYSIRVVLKV